MSMNRRGLLQALGLAPGWVAALSRPAASRPPAGIRSVPGGPYLLNRVYVAGLVHHEGLPWVQAGQVRPGDRLTLRAEPENPHDPWAVELIHPRLGIKLGYVPRTDNKHLSRLLRQGAGIGSEVVEVFPEGRTWRAVRVEIWVEG